MPFLFGKQKKEAAPEPVIVREDPKKQMDATRQNMMKICDALDSISVQRIRASVSEETLPNAQLSEFDRDIKIVNAVISKQTSSQLMLAESDPIDKELFFFAEHIENEMCEGHFLVAETYMKAIKFGISSPKSLQVCRRITPRQSVSQKRKVLSIRINTKRSCA